MIKFNILLTFVITALELSVATFNFGAIGGNTILIVEEPKGVCVCNI